MPVPDTVMSDFPGLINNIDGRDLPPGAAQVQVNLQSRMQGNLQSRRGLVTLAFEQTVTVGVAANT